MKHNLRYPLHYEFFGRWPGKPLGLHPDMLMIALRVAGILGAFFAVWFLRRTLTEIIERGGPLSIQRAANITRQAIATLRRAEFGFLGVVV